MQHEPQLYRLDFSSYISERSEHFTGRDWVFRRIGAWLDAPASTSRYFLLKGAPGSGKTSIAARLAALSRGLGGVHPAGLPRGGPG